MNHFVFFSFDETIIAVRDQHPPDGPTVHEMTGINR
jgi:hypothetical protein